MFGSVSPRTWSFTSYVVPSLPPIVRSNVCRFFFQAEDGIRGGTVTGVQTLLFRSSVPVNRSPASEDTSDLSLSRNRRSLSRLAEYCMEVYVDDNDRDEEERAASSSDR